MLEHHGYWAWLFQYPPSSHIIAYMASRSSSAFTLWPWPFDLEIGSRVTCVMGFHTASFGLPRPFHSWVRLRHAIDRQSWMDRQTDGRTDRRTDRHCPSFYNAPPYRGRRIIILLCPIPWQGNQIQWSDETLFCHCQYLVSKKILEETYTKCCNGRRPKLVHSSMSGVERQSMRPKLLL